MTDDLSVTILVIDFMLWAVAMMLALSKHVRKHEAPMLARSRRHHR